MQPTTYLAIGVTVLAFSAFLLFAYKRKWDWAGLGEYRRAPDTTSPGYFERAKTLWDWLNLAIVPITLTIVAVLVSYAASTRERDLTSQQAQDALLQSYLDEMAGLILDHGLSGSSPPEPSTKIARSMTLSVLPSLDATRKALVLRFLYDSHLVDCKPARCEPSIRRLHCGRPLLRHSSRHEPHWR